MLSREYDKYILEIVPDLTEWYEGNGDTLISYEKYMDAKISKGEAFMAVTEENDCCGIIAISIKNNRISFFGISEKHNFKKAGEMLLKHALSMFDTESDIISNIIDSNAKPFQMQFELFIKHGFIFSHNGFEHGVPIKCMVRRK